ncbi:MAG: LptF/LptG family permease [Spirochaetes bacterium]|nr:LptF/LptG family permease [Spirochaetota bacterium]
MKRLDKYLIRQFLTALAGSLIFMLGMYVITIYLDNLKYFSHPEVDFSIILEFIFSSVPEILIHVLPPAALFATSYLFGNMNSSNEIIAVYNGGVGFARLMAPLLITGVIIAVFSFLFFEFISVDCSKHAFETRNQIKKNTGKSLGYMYSNFDFFLKSNDGTIYYMKQFHSENNRMYNPVIFRFDKSGNLIFQLSADNGVYSKNKWVFRNAYIIKKGSSGKYLTEKKASCEMILKEKPEDFMKSPEKMMHMRIREAKRFIQEKRKEGANYKKYLVEYNWRFAFPFSVLVTIFIGSLCGIYFRKAVLVLAFFLSIIISFGYYGIMAVGMAYGKSGKLDPVVAAWLGNAVYLIIGIIALRLKK